ncbi:hypothetical protein M3Y95_00394000 [Aphelenchoides besseyi]|nr:hypothetical protein M3Y95_00394000 [Aphelenchoides besseyi]
MLVLYLILLRSPASLQSIRKILLIIHIVDLFVLIIYALGRVRTRYVNGIGLISVVGLISLLPFKVQLILNVAYIISLLIPFVILPLPLWYRDRLLRRGPPSNSTLFRCLGLMLLFVLIAILLYIFTIITSNRTIDYGPLWYQETPIPPLIVIDSERSLLAFMSLMYVSVVMALSFLISVFIAFQSYWFLRNHSREVGNSRSMNQFTRLIVVQMIIPTVDLFLPLIATLVFIDTGDTNEAAQNFMSMIVVWSPFIDSITTLIFIVPYRRAIISQFRRVTGHSSQSIALFVHPVSTAPVNSNTK